MIIYLIKIGWWLRTQLLRVRGMKIGYFSYVARAIFIYGADRISIGNKVRIFPGVRMEVHEGGCITIREDVSIGQNFHIISAKEELSIGAHTTISGNVFITNIDHDYREVGKHILKQSLLVHHTNIGENCFIGYGAAIQAGTVLGKHCIVGANSVVRGTFPDYCVIVGVPGRVIKKYNPLKDEWEKINNNK